MKFFLNVLLNRVFPRKRWLFLIGGVLAAFLSCSAAVSAVSANLLEQAVGVKVSVSRFSFHPYPLKLGLYGIKIHNPPGFKEKVLADVPEIYFEVNPLAILKGRIHVREIRLSVEDIAIERNAQGKINLNEMIRVLNEKQKAAQKSGPSQPAPGEPRTPPAPEKPKSKPKQIPMTVDRVIVNLGDARFVESGKSSVSEKRIKLNIRDFELKNVTDPASVTEQIVVMILKKMGLMAINAQLGDVQKNIENQAKIIAGQIQQTFQEWMK